MSFECPNCGNDQYFSFKTESHYKLKPDISGKFHATLDECTPYQGVCGECSEALPQHLLKDLFKVSEIINDEEA